jgi:predicted nucleic acid-binding protein
MTTYLLDSNIFIQAKNLHYGFDFCPGFWDWLDEAHAAKTVYSIDNVRTELIAGSDELADWARQRPTSFFLTPTAATVPSLQAASVWASTAGYDPAAVTGFLQVADYYLVAQALEHRYTVVTHEIVANTTRRIKIPNACLELGIRYVTPFTMLRSEKARFVLPTLPLPNAA